MMRHAILARLDEDPFSDTAKAKLRVSIDRVGKMFQASYELCDEEGKCVQGAPVPEYRACINTVESVAFSVGIFMPGLLTESTPARRDPPPDPPACQDPPRDPPARREPPPVKLPVSFRLDGGVLLSIDSAPVQAATAFWVHVGARWRNISISGGFRQELPATRDTGAIHLTTSRSLGELVPCVHWGTRDSTNIAFCGLLQIGGLRALGETPYSLQTDEKWTVLAGGRVGVEVPVPTIFPSARSVPFLSHLAFLVPVDLTVAVVRPRISMREAINWSPRYVPMGVGFGLVFSP
jgi:hypothetical protein